MAEIERKRVVPIHLEVPRANAQFGTGYVIAPGVILTAKHVVIPLAQSVGAGAECQEEPRLRVLSKQSKQWLDAKVAWRSDRQDLALITAELPCSGIHGQRLLSSRMPRRHAPWSADGYAAVSTEASVTREVEPEFGHVAGPRGEAEDCIDLGTIAQPDNWHGMSGAPVFCQEQGQLIAVVCWERPHHRGTRITATRLDRALKDPVFIKLLGEEEPDEQHKYLLSSMENVFESGALPADLLTRLGIRGDAKEYASEAAAALADIALGQTSEGDHSISPFASVADRFYDALYDHQCGELPVLANPKVRMTFSRLLGAVVALRYNDSSVEERVVGPGTGHKVLLLPDTSDACVEARAARHVGRPAVFLVFEGKVRGRSAVPVGALEVGPDAAQAADAIVDYLARWFDVELKAVDKLDRVRGALANTQRHFARRRQAGKPAEPPYYIVFPEKYASGAYSAEVMGKILTELGSKLKVDWLLLPAFQMAGACDDAISGEERMLVSDIAQAIAEQSPLEKR